MQNLFDKGSRHKEIPRPGKKAGTKQDIGKQIRNSKSFN
jgi:hypothetical protein